MTETITAAQFRNSARKKKSGSDETPAQRVSNAIGTWLALHGWIYWKNGASAREIEGRYVKTGTKGLPDIMAVKAGRMICIETKASVGDRMRDAQRDWRERFEKQGILYIVAKTVDDVIGALE